MLTLIEGLFGGEKSLGFYGGGRFHIEIEGNLRGKAAIGLEIFENYARDKPGSFNGGAHRAANV